MFVIGIIFALIIMINPYVSSLGAHVRWLDILSIIGLPILLWQITLRRIHTLIGLGLVVLLLIPWLIVDWQTDPDFGTSIASLSVHWLGLSIIAVGLVMVNGTQRGRQGLALGMILSAIAHCLILYLQYRGHAAQLISMGLCYPAASKQQLALAAQGRFSGINPHPNATAAAIAMCVPATIALITEFRKSRLFLFGAIAICVPGVLLTFSRSAFLVAGTLTLVWFFMLRSKYKYFVVPVLLLTAVILITAFASPQLAARWSENAQTDQNAGERWSTTKQSFTAILQSPLGLGSNFHQLLDPPMPATHNSFTELALLSGLPLALLVLVSMLNSVRKLGNGGSLIAWLAAQLVGLCFFDEYFSGPTFIVMTLWIVFTNIEDAWRAFGRRAQLAPLLPALAAKQ